MSWPLSDQKDYGIMLKQLGASIFFGICSIFIVMVNKVVLTTYTFPSFQVIGLGQMITIILVVGGARILGIIDFPGPSTSQVQKVWPLPAFYVLNLVFGLGSTKKLSLPMYTVLRRFTLLIISVGQIYVLDHYESIQVNVTLLVMVGGALIAALNDLAFDLMGYFYILMTNLSTAAGVVYSKQKLNTEMTKLELLFYNALIAFVPALLVAVGVGDISLAYNYEGWNDPMFLVFFFLSCMMGLVLMYATALVNQLTSPLTLAVVGCIKNVLVTYLGMFVGGDYIFDTNNFVGINISVGASIAYSIFKFQEQHKNSEKVLPSSSNKAINNV